MTVINSRLGAIEGIDLGDVQAFLGIRFGQAPVGNLRFKAALAEGPWQGTYDATKPRHRSLQAPPMDFFASAGRPATDATYAEDCLFLNIYTPRADDKKRPVLYWIHGGAFTMGSGYDYDGRVLADQGDVVVVTINYRLGLLGFLDMSGQGEAYRGSASNGIGDQILGLQWVRDNIADYGGDPGNVMIFGESAGASSVNALLAAPGADGLYHRAIAHSGGAVSTPPNRVAPALAAHLGVDEADLLQKLETLSGQEIFDAQAALGTGGGSCVDGVIVTRSTTQAIADRGERGVPYIAGSNANEGTLFSMLLPGDEEVYASMGHQLAKSTMEGADPAPYLQALKGHYAELGAKEHYEHVWNDMFRRASIHNAQAASAAGTGGWLYRFDLPTTIMEGKLGATHACEVPFTFNTFANPDVTGIAMHDRDDSTVKQLAQVWSSTVLNFARTGDPNGGGLPQWPRYEAATRRSLVMDAESTIADGELDIVHRKLWGDA